MSDATRGKQDDTGGSRGRQSGNAVARCQLCQEHCDVLVLAAVGPTVTAVWKCPMRLGSERMDRAVSLALIRASLAQSPCIVIHESDLDGWDG